mgnify:CR=1 FL=1
MKSPIAYMMGKPGIFISPKAWEETWDWNFSKSQRLYRGGKMSTTMSLQIEDSLAHSESIYEVTLSISLYIFDREVCQGSTDTIGVE